MGECWLFHCRGNFLVAGSNLVAFRPIFRRSSNYRARATRNSWAKRNYLQGNANPLTTWRKSRLVGLPDKSGPVLSLEARQERRRSAG